MLCSNCNADMPVDDRFCEECGTPMSDAPVPAPVAALPPCARCGAPASAADEEGFCNECGFRREKPREHTEVIIDASFAGVTDQGKRHAHNEDNMGVADEAGAKILVVCDGVSSSQDAASASRAAAQAAVKALTTSKESATKRLRASMRAAWQGVADVPYTMSEGDPPSTTFVAAVVEGNRATVAWAGDSRAYWLAGEASKQLTVDDSWLNDTVAEGKISYEEAMHSDKAHAITKWLGADAGEPEPTIVTHELTEPGVLLLCSDGLWNYAEEPKRLEELAGSHEQGAIEMARRLVDFANSCGGRDNITAVVYIHTPATTTEPEPPAAATKPEPQPIEDDEEEPVTRVTRRRFSFGSMWQPMPSFQKGT